MRNLVLFILVVAVYGLIDHMLKAYSSYPFPLGSGRLENSLVVGIAVGFAVGALGWTQSIVKNIAKGAHYIATAIVAGPAIYGAAYASNAIWGKGAALYLSLPTAAICGILVGIIGGFVIPTFYGNK